jgi:type IV secretory pathway component VirB8
MESKNNKPQKKQVKKSTDDYIRSIGQPLFMVNLLKGILIILALVLLAESALLVSLLGKVSEVKPLPIFVDREAGTARAVDFSAIDASGEKRDESEIHDFIRDFISNLYTYTSHTVESNLRRVLDQSSVETRNTIKNIIYDSNRNQNLVSGYQGSCKFSSISIIEATPSLIRAQAIFIEQTYGSTSEVKTNKKIATIALKTVLRQRDNAHGLFVVEYRESDIKE